MSSVDINLLKQLREITFAPLKDCREALIEANGDLDQAQELLRKKWILKAWTRWERETKEWIVKVIEKDWRHAGIKLLCETDFVAKNEDFIKLANDILKMLLPLKKEIKSIQDLDPSLLDKMNEMVSAFVGKIWENLKLADVILSKEKWFVYNHPWNKITTVIYYKWDNADIAKELALQVTAMNPQYLSFDSVPADSKEKLLEEFRKEMEWSNKPAAMIENIIQWKLKKNLAESVLTEQEYIRDASKKVKDIIPSDFVLKWFSRLSIR